MIPETLAGRVSAPVPFWILKWRVRSDEGQRSKPKDWNLFTVERFFNKTYRIYNKKRRGA